MDAVQLPAYFKHFLFDIKQKVNADLCVLSFTSHEDKSVHVCSLNADHTPHTMIIPGSSFKSFTIYDGNLYVITYDNLHDDVTSMHSILEKDFQYSKTCVTRQFSHEMVGNGAILLSSRYQEGSELKRKFESLNLVHLFDYHLNIRDAWQNNSATGDNKRMNEAGNLLLHSRIASAITDQDGNILGANKMFEELTGYSSLKLQEGMNIEDLVIHRNAATRVQRSVYSSLNQDGDEYILLCKNNEERYIKMIVDDLPAMDGKIVQLIDLTSVRERERGIKEQLEVLATINRINRTINSNITMQNVMDSIIVSLQDVADFDLLTIVMGVPIGSEFKIYSFRKGHVTATQSLHGSVSRELKNYIADLEDGDSLNKTGESFLKLIHSNPDFKVQSSIMVNMNTEDGVVGVIGLFSSLRNAYANYHVEVLKGVRDQIAIALMRAELQRQSLLSLSFYQQLQAFEAEILGAQTRDDIYRLTSKAAARAVDARYALIQNIGNDSYISERQALSLKMNQKIRSVIDDGEPLILKNLYQYYTPEQLKQMELRSLSIFPIFDESRKEALLYLYFDKSRVLLEQEVFFVETVLELSSNALRRMRRVQQIEQNLSKYKQFIDHSADMMILTDRDGKIMFLNEAGKKNLGYENGYYVGKSIHSLMLNGRLQFSNLKAELLNQQQSMILNTDMLSSTGDFIPVSWKFSVIKEKDECLAFLGVGRDITESRLNEKTSENKYEDLEQFLLKMSHNLKAPLATQQGYLSLLKQEYSENLDEEGLFYMERLLKNSEQMEAIINDLLLFLRYNHEEHNSENVDLNDLLKSIIDDIGYKKDIYFSIPQNLPSLMFDRDELKVIFTNIISNSIKYMGDVDQPRIEIDVERANGEYHFQVTDNGIGIDKKHQPYIFNLFYRARESKGIDGTGIGLAIVKKIIENHHGSVYVDSEPGKGTAIHFTIPTNNVLKEYVMN
ncbi:PAS domain S-box protein [candidate division KSB1 bacterium]|nr:PAS domain S-box protein [candidate division KSB1 bacterium]